LSDILPMLQTLLRQAAYSTRLAAVGDRAVLMFEDDSVIGFATEFETAQDLIANWQSVESKLVERFGESFRSAGDKAWNVYMLLLSSGRATAEQTREVQWIEENLDRTRKLAACGVSSREALVRVVYPVLPIQHQPNLKTEDVSERLLRTLRATAPTVARVALDESVPPSEIVRLLGETP
jgi:hypothetical protein